MAWMSSSTKAGGQRANQHINTIRKKVLRQLIKNTNITNQQCEELGEELV